MKKKSLLLSFFLFIALSGLVFSQQEFLFRGLPWGATPEQVKAKEGEPDGKEEKEGRLVYLRYQNKDVAGYKTKLEYAFNNNTQNGITASSYMLNINRSYLMLQEPDPTNFINAYVDLQSKLISVYGNPKSRKNLEHVEDGMSTLMAQRYRAGSPYATIWETGITRIYLMILYNSKETRYSTEIIYTTKPYWDWVEQNILGAPSKSTDGL